MSRTSLRSNTDLPPPSDRRVPHLNRGDGWNALADIEVFVFAVEAELEAMDRERVGVHRRGRKPDLTLRRGFVANTSVALKGLRWCDGSSETWADGGRSHNHRAAAAGRLEHSLDRAGAGPLVGHDLR